MVVDEFGREVPGGRKRGRSYSFEDEDYSSPHRRRRDFDDDDDHWRRHRRYHSRSPSPSPYKRRHGRHRHDDDDEDDRSPHYRRRRRPSQRPAAERYVSEPMLCEFLWKQQHQQKEDEIESNKMDDTKDERPLTGEEEEPKLQKEEEEAAPSQEKDEQGKDEQDKDNDVSTATNGQQQKEESYDDYRHAYCLNYVRSFFNQHMDDSWFRLVYSPLHRKRAALDDMASKEALAIKDEIKKSLQEQKQDEKQEHDACCSFVREARLGHGTKEQDLSSQKSSSHPQQVIPKSHVLSIIQESRCIVIYDVPPHVSDEQIRQALLEHCHGSSKEPIKVYSTTPTSTDTTSSSSNNNDRLLRQAYAVLSSSTVRDDILTDLYKANYDAQRMPSPPHAAATTGDGTGTSIIPRKEHDVPLPKYLDLDVDCTDPYGRSEIDADGKGNAPKDDKDKVESAKEGTTSSSPSSSSKVPTRKCTIVVQTTMEEQPVTVLSAAVSSSGRIARDKGAAIMLARALDVSRSIPRGVRLDDLLELLFPESTQQQHDHEQSTFSAAHQQQMVADVLDVSIAYLRRVHLFSFYNGCTRCTSIGDVLGGKHAASTIHLRFKDADELLHATEKELEGMYGDLDDAANAADPSSAASTDLLVMRLDESISKALEESTEWVARAGRYVIDETVDGEAAEIEVQEEKTKTEWIENHGLVDMDGRARCSFHFCRKLFKDQNFLKKHLLKKHSEFLRAEMAKCHDSYMMKAWDAESNRPVPPVLVDCGSNFGLVPSIVTGAQHPTAADPEPELWRRKEERRKRFQEENEQRYNERRYARPPEGDDHRDTGHRNRGEDHDEGDKQDRIGSSFVDVDDVKVEKVELSFENVSVPIVQPKKKKKKRKLL